MNKLVARKRAIEYCESLNGLTNKEKEIAYKAYLSALVGEEEKEVEEPKEKTNLPSLFIPGCHIVDRCGSIYTPTNNLCGGGASKLNRC